MQTTPPVVDLHEDLAYYVQSSGAGQPYAPLDRDLEGRQADIPKYRRANVRLVFAALFPGVDSYTVKGMLIDFNAAAPLALSQLKAYYRLAEAHREIALVEDADSAEAVVRGREWRLGLLIHMEGAYALTEPYDLRLLYRLGLRSIGLTWNYGNRFAAGCCEKKDYGLTAAGEELVREANRLGVIVDLAHASWQTMRDVLEVSSKPVIVSHGNPASRVESKRNVPEDVLEQLHRRGGVIGVTFISRTLVKEGEATIDHVADVIVDLVQRYGDTLPAIGTDYHGLPASMLPKGLEAVDKLPVLLEKLAERGLTDNQLARVAYENALRVIRENLG